MKILILNHEFPPIGGGGGRAAEDICAHLTKIGHEIIVLTSKYNQLPSKEITKAGSIIRIPTGRKFAFRAKFFDMAMYIFMGFWYGLYLIIFKKPDIIHVHFAVPAGFLAWLLNKLTGVPYVLTAHLGDIPGGNPEKTNKWFRWILPFTSGVWSGAAHIATVSEYTKMLVQKQYACDVEVIPNGVDMKILDPGKIRVNNPPRILFAGRFAPQKNLSTFVEILSAINDLEWDCIMIGDGEEFSAIQNKIYQLGLDSKITLTGWVTPEEVISNLKSGDILLMPSISEGLPVVGVQAVALGLAIVSSPVGGFIDLVDNNKNGYLIDGYNILDWRKAMSSLIEDKEKLTFFRNSSRSHASRFSIENVSSRYEKVFRSVLRSA